MWIESLDLDDFGHFDRARVGPLDDGLTVIAGPQRAGKTTFMDAVRHLGYGLGSGTSAPPPTDRYDVTATVVSNGYRYELAIDGHAEPAVTPLDDGAPEQTARELFGNMRKTQYQQLYTVSLDELSRSPPSLGDEVDLSNVLLEASSGGNITEVPHIKEEFAKRAKQIGGKHGRSSYDLKGPRETIQEGIEQRDAATEQVAEYEEIAAEKRGVEDRIDEIEEEIEDAETERTRLEAVVSGHETYQELEERIEAVESAAVEDAESFPTDRLEEARSLRETLETKRRERQDAEQAFESTVSADDPTSYREGLIDARQEIEQFDHEQSGWKQQVETVREREESLAETRQELEQEAANLGIDADSDPLDAVRNVDTDLFSQDAVDQAVERYRSATSDIEDLSQTIDELEGRQADLEDRIADSDPAPDGISRKQTATVAGVGALVALAAGSALAVAVDPLVGVSVTTLVLLVTGTYAFSLVESEVRTQDGVSVETLRAEAGKLENELELKEQFLADRQSEREAAEETLEELRETYDLPEDVSAEAVGQFYDDLISVQDRLVEYEGDRDRLDDRVEQLRSDLAEVVDTLDEVGVLDEPIEDPVENASEVFAAVDRAVEDLDSATDVHQADQRLGAIETAIATLLEGWEGTPAGEDDTDDPAAKLDRFVDHGETVEEYQSLQAEREEVRSTLLNQLQVQTYAAAFEPVASQSEDDGDEWLLDAYEAVLEDHGGIDAVAERQTELDSMIDELEAETEASREKRTQLEQELEALSSDSDVREAHEVIERGQKQLEPLAEAYATNRIAEYLLAALHERFIERTTGPLMAEASDIFQRITGDTYAEIDTRNEFEDLDFAAVLADGGVHRTNELSRATAEQLFLAVRLARIKRFDEPLPVLLDDSLTNFDPGHAKRTLDVVCELADETQVFLLTCHPTLVETVADSYDAQYWCLDAGTFDGPHETTEPVRALFEPEAPEQQP